MDLSLVTDSQTLCPSSLSSQTLIPHVLRRSLLCLFCLPRSCPRARWQYPITRHLRKKKRKQKSPFFSDGSRIDADCIRIEAEKHGGRSAVKLRFCSCFLLPPNCRASSVAGSANPLSCAEEMAAGPFSVDLICTFLLTCYLLNKFVAQHSTDVPSSALPSSLLIRSHTHVPCARYGNPWKSPIVTVTVFVAWFFSFSIVLILPLDISAVRLSPANRNRVIVPPHRPMH